MQKVLLRFLAVSALAGWFLGIFCVSAGAQRLPRTVKPVHYALTLTPDLATATFVGLESVDVVVSEPVDTITLNAIEIKFLTVTTQLGGKTVGAKWSEDAGKQQATLDFGQRIPAGKLTLQIAFTGILNGELRGFYLSKTAKRSYAVTQFEATDARRAFPCFDEPAMKATFSVTLNVDKGDTAISNTNIIKDAPLAMGTMAQDPKWAGKHSITFAETPKMSTYLVAFLVGDFQCISGESDGVPIRACATPDQVQYGKFALSAAEYVLHYYDTYFGIKYPMPKLDMIAIPDFEAGAMENFGAITYRETDLLIDPSHASVGALKRVADVVAHEMAHQWFGDMVTMQWWDNLWLNEGFASWMENKPVAAWKPEWNVPQDVVRDTQKTLDLDARRVTRTIRATADTPDEINEMFDGISYGKAGAMLLMVENYLGEETFRRGVHDYLAAHLYGNASAEDFWNAQTAVSHKPVDRIMESFVAQPGVPLLSVTDVDGTGTGGKLSGKIQIGQRRFFLNAKSASEKPESWTVPVCLKAAGGQRCEVIASGQGEIAAPHAELVFANARGAGYYRTLYPASEYSKLVHHAAELSAEERVSFLGDTWALARAGKTTVGAYLDLVGALSSGTNADVLKTADAGLNAIGKEVAATPEERSRLAAWVRVHFEPAYRALGKPRAEDSAERRELRAELLDLLAGLGADADAIEEAKALTLAELANRGSVETTLAETALKIAARNGDAELFDQLQKLAEGSGNPQQRSASLRALALFRDPALETRALEYAVSGRVKNQDVVSLLNAELGDVQTQELAWRYIGENWQKVFAQLTTDSGTSFVNAAGGFCSAEKIEAVSSFYATHKVPASARALARAKDSIQDCVDLRAGQEANLVEWLAKQQ